MILRTLKDIRAHYNKLYTEAEEGTVACMSYYNILRELQQTNTKQAAQKGIKFMRDVAPLTDVYYYQVALNLLKQKKEG